MIPIYQQTPDECLRACIASILEIPYEDVPSFYNDENVNGAIKWVYDNHELLMLCTTMPDDSWNLKLGEAYHIRSFTLSGYEHAHAVVAKSGKIVHDPAKRDLSDYKDKYYNHDYFFINPLI